MTTALAKLQNFVHAFGAMRMLIQRANKDGYMLEGLALYASMSDGFLRMGLVLKRQNVNRSPRIDESLISQEQDGHFYTDRQIHRMACDEGIIDRDLFKEIGILYEKRNDAIHRFFGRISNTTICPKHSNATNSCTSSLLRSSGIWKLSRYKRESA